MSGVYYSLFWIGVVIVLGVAFAFLYDFYTRKMSQNNDMSK